MRMKYYIEEKKYCKLLYYRKKTSNYYQEYQSLKEEIEIPAKLLINADDNLSKEELKKILKDSDDYLKQLEESLIEEVQTKLKNVRENLKSENIMRKIKIPKDLINKSTQCLISGKDLEKYTNEELSNLNSLLDNLMKEIEVLLIL